ncbi:hypothetical protein FSP39_002096 [Pinctada imbricata]|uniref:C2H2-type domain-containing protein n=1 Tax=Pinctada imbricata TaxID=66713 RepID=A0AA89BYK5_PINIB|nr:hypothetical protein FSP39_002096 [Pinctada imbricata]
MSDRQKGLVARLLKQSILTVCKETVPYSQHLEIDGIVCISSEDEAKQIVIKVHELFQRSNAELKNIESPSVEFRDQPNGEASSASLDLHNGKMDFSKGTEAGYDGLGAGHTMRENGKLSIIEGVQNGLSQSGYRSSAEKGSRGRQEEMRQNMKEDISEDIWSEDSENFDIVSSPEGSVASSGMDQLSIGRQTPVENTASASVITKPIVSRIFPKKAIDLRKNAKKTFDMNVKIENEESGTEDAGMKNKEGSNTGAKAMDGSSPGYIYNAEMPAIVTPTVQDIECKRCGMVLEDGQAFESHNLSSHNVYTCLVCYNTFTCRNNMKRHMRLHTGYRPYQCTLCSESFTRKDDIKRHLIRHNYNKPFRCSICKKGYMDRKSIKSHLRKDHRRNLVHCCPTCGEAFDDTLQFQEHKKTHPELMVFHCSLCNFTGANPLMYNKHMLVHGRKKSFQCSKCNLDFTDPFKYTTHLKIHRGDTNFTSYRCCFCSHSLETYDSFIKHEHTHVQCKRHTCTVCKKQFRYPSNLREHMLIHSDMSKQIKVTLEKSKEIVTSAFVSPKEEMEEIENSHDSMHSMDDEEVETKLFDQPLDDYSSQYWCTECNQGFSSESHLTEHIAMAHDDNENNNSETNQNLLSEKVDAAMAMTGNETDPNHIPFTYTDLDLEEESIQDQGVSGYGCMKVPMTPAIDQMKSELSHHMYQEMNSESAKEFSYMNGDLKVSQENSEPQIEAEPKVDTGLDGNDDDDAIVYHRKKQMGYSGVSSIPVFPQNETDNFVLAVNHVNHAPPSTSPNGFLSPITTTTRSPGFERVVTPDVLFRTKVPFECDICKAFYNDFDEFDKHCNNVHRRFICDFCGKQFTSKPNRDRHVRYHTGEKPYKCELCNLSFFRGDDLKYHRTTRHSDVKPFSCSKCRMNFAWAKDLEKHLKTHK